MQSPAHHHATGDDRHSLAWPLVGVWLLLIVYASLYPFSDWRDPGVPCWVFVTAPLPHYWTWFDLIANVLGYMPLGFLLVLGWRTAIPSSRGWQRGLKLLGLVLATLLAGSVLSFTMESIQCWLPSRRASNLDLITNAFGSVLGGMIAAALDWLGLTGYWTRWRSRWFDEGTRGAQFLLLLWPCVLLYPLEVPFGLGQVLEGLETTLADWLAGTPLADWLPWRAIEFQPMLPETWNLVMVLGLLAPCLLAFSALPQRRHRLAALLLLLAAGPAATAVSWELAFGARMYMFWQPAMVRMAAPAVLLAGLLGLWLPRRLLSLLGIVVLGAQLYLINDAAVSVYYSWAAETSMQRSFVHLYGLTQWLGLAWPWLALGWLLQRLFRPLPPRSSA